MERQSNHGETWLKSCNEQVPGKPLTELLVHTMN